jgi:hypothetical protein
MALTMLLNINLSNYAQKTIYLEVNVDNSVATWNFSFMGFKHNNSEGMNQFDLGLGPADTMIDFSYSFFFNCSNDTQFDLSLNINLKWYYLDSGNKIYLTDIQTIDPWKMPISLPTDKPPILLKCDVNFLS